MLIKCLDILGMASHMLRQEKACPHTAQQIDLDVKPAVRKMAAALEYVRDSQPPHTVAHQRAVEALAAYEGEQHLTKSAT